MKNVVYVSRPSIIVNQRGAVVEGVRPDTAKNQREVKLTSRRFSSLREFMSWITKEGSKKSTITYLMDLRPASGGQYDARVASTPAPRPSSKTSASKSTSAKSAVASSNSSRSSSSSSTRSNRNSPSKTTAVTPSGAITGISSARGASANKSNSSANRPSIQAKASVNRKRN